MDALTDIDVVILAGGFGTRLQSVLPDRQKVVADISGRPFLAFLIEDFARAGCRRVILALGHRAEQVMDLLAPYRPAGVEIVASVEPEPLGTGGAARLALAQTRSRRLLLTNGDSFLPVDHAQLVAAHIVAGAAATLVVTAVDSVARYGEVVVAEDGAIHAFREKQDAGDRPGLINAGRYLIEREALEILPRDRPASLERDLFPALCGGALYAFQQDGPFIDIGTPDSLRSASRYFESLGASA
ncbi:MAG: sugar phosphate nucleotidyltransferase [Alphaproteobacteria bacterium]